MRRDIIPRLWVSIGYCVLVVLAVAGCTAGVSDLAEPVATTREALTGPATVRGRVFYNDHRKFGQFSSRRTPSGATGAQATSSTQQNWLAARLAVVDIFDWCSDERLGSGTVSSTGAFDATVSLDGCNKVYAEVRLRYCGDEICVSMNSDDDEPYRLYASQAQPNAPLTVHAGDDIDIGDVHFNPGTLSATFPNDHQNAANHYATVVDTVLTVIRDDGIPFFKDEFGELQYIFPSDETITATTKDVDRVVISVNDFDSGWAKGRWPAHEFGHVLMLRAWDGDYGFDGVGNSAWADQRADSTQIAFKEAWAEMTARRVFAGSHGCEDIESGTLYGPLGDGSFWRDNITMALCDWLDTHNDHTAGTPGAGDHFHADDFHSMWFNLRHMYLDADQYGADPDDPGLNFCDYVDYYLNVRQSAAAVGATSHADHVDWIVDLIYNNNITCGFPTPN